MKKILIFIFVLASYAVSAQYNPSLHTVTNKPLGFSQATPTDARSYYFDPALFIYRPYQSTAEVLSYLNIAKYRAGNFPIYINVGGTLQSGGTFTGGGVVEYWFKDGTGNSNLVVKSTDVGYTVAGLRALNTATNQTYTSTDKGGGNWIDIGPSDGVINDDGAIYIITANNHILKRVYSGLPYVEWFGAKGDGVTNDGAAIQSAITTAISLHLGGVRLNGSKYYTTSGFSFGGINAVSNASQFGFRFEGVGMQTEILSNITGGVLFDFSSSNDLQVYFSNIFAYDQGGTTLGLRLQHLSRYSKFDNFRLYGFSVGHRYTGEMYGVSFNNCSIRGTKGRAIEVDDVAIAGGVLTEFRYTDCYIDNNCTLGANGATSISTMYLFNCQEFTFNRCVFEGNFGGGITISGASQNVIFSGGRLEETQMSFGTGGHIHNFASTVGQVVFDGVQISYDKNGVDGTKNYQAFLCQNKQTLFKNCHFVEQSNTVPTDFFGATPSTANVVISNPMYGYNTSYFVTFPPQFIKTPLSTYQLTDKNLWLYDAANPTIPKPSVVKDFTDSVYINKPVTIPADAVYPGIHIKGSTTFGGFMTFDNLSNPYGWTIGLPGNTTGSFFIYNKRRATIPFLIDTATDHVTLNGTLSAPAAVNSSDVIIKSQLDAKFTSGTPNFLLKFNGTASPVNSVISDNGTDATITNSLFTGGTLYTGKAGTGTGGSLRYYNDAGVIKWSTGLPGNAGASDFRIVDAVNSSAIRLGIDGTTGAATFGSTVAGSPATASNQYITRSQLTDTLGANQFTITNATGSGDSTLAFTSNSATAKRITVTGPNVTKTVSATAIDYVVGGLTTGTVFFSGNGSTTTFDITLPVTPSWTIAVAASTINIVMSVAQITNGIRIIYASAPPSGTNNIAINYAYK